MSVRKAAPWLAAQLSPREWRWAAAGQRLLGRGLSASIRGSAIAAAAAAILRVAPLVAKTRNTQRCPRLLGKVASCAGAAHAAAAEGGYDESIVEWPSHELASLFAAPAGLSCKQFEVGHNQCCSSNCSPSSGIVRRSSVRCW